MAQPKLVAVIFCQPEAKRYGGEPLSSALHLPETLSASRALEVDEIKDQFVSVHLRPTDVPLAFLRESSADPAAALARYQDMPAKLEAYGRLIQYRFDDGLTLIGSQILFHSYSRYVPRHLLPLNVNVSNDLRARLRFGRVSSWQVDADQTILSILLAANRASRLAKTSTEVDPLILYFAHDDNPANERGVVTIESVDLSSEEWGPWRVNTSLPEPVSHAHYGRARLELDPEKLGSLHGLSQTFFVDVERHRLIFHGFEDQLQRLRSRLPGQLPTESGLSLHLTGHGAIQASIQEITDLWGTDSVPIFPRKIEVAEDKIKPRLSMTSDGSFRFTFVFESLLGASTGSWEAHGLPQSSAYLLLNLQHGLGATTGFANTQIAHTRRGLKRERDMKILRSVGYSTLIFFDAANFALGLPLSDGTSASSETEVCESLYQRLGSFILKSEGWPVQAGGLNDLCSKNVTTLIEGFVKQVVMDIRGRDIAIYLPEGEFKLKGLSKHVALLFHAMVSDLAQATNGQCFSKARTRHFENFMNGRAHPEKEDMVVRHEIDAETAARMVYQPGINERYRFPESGTPGGRGEHVLSLLHKGYQVSIDGKDVEEFDATEFRPEFTLREPGADAIATGGHKIDWFELNPKFFFRGTEITGEQAHRLSREGLLEFQGKLYRVKNEDMPSLKRLTKFWASIQAEGAGVSKSKRRKTEDTYLQLPRSQTLELLALRASGVKMRGGPKWDHICRFYDSLDQPREPFALPESFKTQLQPYQISGVQWIRDLHELGLGGILADDMGLGKTVTSLAFLEVLRTENRMGATLILVPTSLTYNWQSEAERFTPDMPVQIFSSRDSESMFEFLKQNSQGAVICTYGLLQENIEIFQQVHWGCLILDEAQNLKNITTKRTTAARKLEATFKLCLTGTPIENHYGELFSLFDLIVPGSLGDIASFRERFVNPVRVLREDIDYLKIKTKPLVLRRTKSQVMHQLPPKVEQTVKLPFEEEQRRIYRDIATSYNDQMRAQIARQGEAKSQLQMLTALLRLRQVCSDPASIPGVQYAGEPPKVSTLLEAIKELTESGASALVFTQFLATFERIRAALEVAKVKHFDISGADSRINRERKIRAFQEESDGAVMLMTLKTGGVGLNLIKASYIFHIEPWWNPAVENQATDRAHRIGQTKTVQVYRYIIKDSVEEKIEVLKDIKSKRFDALFSVSENETELGSGSSSLSQRDFEFLLG